MGKYWEYGNIIGNNEKISWGNHFSNHGHPFIQPRTLNLVGDLTAVLVDDWFLLGFTIDESWNPWRISRSNISKIIINR
jgi:hypothetical protein